MPRISNIVKIKNLRNFIDFDASYIELRKNEVIYANNGSGKTNISRLFYYIKNPDKDINELKSKEAKEIDRVEFEIIIDNVSINQDNYKEEVNQKILKFIQIFNSDFIDRNINCPDFSEKQLDGELVIEIGEPDANIKKLDKKIKLAETQIKSTYQTISKDFSTYIERKKSEGFKPGEVNIWKYCSLDYLIDLNSKKINAEFINNLNEQEYNNKLLSSIGKRRDLLKLDGQEKLNYIQTEIHISDILAFDDDLSIINEFPDVDEAMENNFKFVSLWLNNEALANNISTEEVLLAGINLSEEKEKCILCKRSLDDNTEKLFENYKAFFEAEKSKFIQGLKKKRSELTVTLNKVDLIKNDNEREVNRLAELFNLEERWIKYDTKEIINALELYVALLDEKASDISISLGYDENKELNSLLEVINNMISKNKDISEKLDRKIDNTVIELAEQRKYVGQKLLLDFYNENKSKFDLIDSNYSDINTNRAELSKMLESLPKIDSRTSISKLMNFFLKDRVGIDKYKSEVIDEQVVIKLNGFNISQFTGLISEGERTILGLCYFFASSIDELCSFKNFSESIFIIDDPVSSTAYANFFGISTLIKKFAHDIKQELWPTNSDPSVQAIVLTHNTQFLNLLKKQVWKDSDINNGFNVLSLNKLKRIPQGQLLSEFQTAMWRVYKKTIQPEFNDNISNDIRRIIETLKHFYGLRGDFNAESLIKIFPYAASKNYEVLYAVINHYSHGSPEDPDILPPDSIDNAAVDIAELFENEQSPFRDMWESIKCYENE